MKFLGRVSLVFRTCCSVLRGDFQLLCGIWRISRIKGPIVSIFGSSYLTTAEPYIRKAHILAQKLVAHNISVMTGGGPGIMQAANCGAMRGTRSTSLGIGVRELEQARTLCVGEYFEVNFFYTRKWLLTHYSIAFVFFPGGFGTLDELADILTLIKTGKLPAMPVVLIGTEYWSGLIDWLRHEGVAHGIVREEHLKMFAITDDLDEAFCLVEDTCTGHQTKIVG